MSYSKACVIKDGAKDWPAMNKWRYQNDGYAYLGQTLRSMPTSVYVDPDATSTIDDFSGFTFKEDSVEVMKFNTEFLSKMTKKAAGMTMRDSNTNLLKLLEKDIKYPKYYHEYG